MPVRAPAAASVIVAAWNAEATIARAVTSALAQTAPVEVVVVDDGSTDGTAAAARAAGRGAARLRVVSQTNAGPSAARNRAIAMATAPWVCPLDADDFMEPGRIAALLAIADGGGWDFVADDLWLVPEHATDGPRRRVVSDRNLGLGPVDLAAFVRGNLSAETGDRGEMGFLKPLMRRKFLKDTAIAYDENMRFGEDYDLYARALVRGARFGLCDPCGYVAVIRPGSLSAVHSARDLRAVFDADRRLLASPSLDPAGRAALRRHLTETWKTWAWMRLIDAVRRRDPREALRCFAAPPPVIGFLCRNLCEQAVLRGDRLLRR